MKHPWSREPQEHDLESLQQHHPVMRVDKLTVHVENCSRFVHLSVLLLVIKTAVLAFNVCGKMRDCSKEQSGYQILSFNALAAHTFCYSILYACPYPSTPPPPHPHFLGLYFFLIGHYSSYFKQPGQHPLFLLIPYPCLHFLFQRMNEN